MVDWAKSSGAKQFLFISSAGIYKPTDEQPHVEGVCCMFIVAVGLQLNLFTLKHRKLHSYRTSLKPMLVMLEWKNILQMFSVVGQHSVHNT